MVCKHCGNQLSISEPKCPYCGMENTEAAEHQKAMHRYEKRFRTTKQEVIGEVKKSRAVTLRIALIAVLAIANILILIAVNDSYWMESFLRERDNKKNIKIYEKEVQQYIAEGDFFGLSSYLQCRELPYSGSDYREYSVMYQAASCYRYIFSMIAELRGDKTGYHSDWEKISTLSNHFVEFYKIYRQDMYSYDKEEHYTEEAVDAIEKMEAQISVLIRSCFELEEEEYKALCTKNQTDIENVLGRRLVLNEE